MASLLFFAVLNLTLALLSSTATEAAVPVSRSTDDSRYIHFDAAEWHPRAKRDDAPKVPLRILPLGASITWGYLSSTGNGYRKPLRDKLRFEGWEVNMVGSKSNGDMVDNVRISPPPAATPHPPPNNRSTDQLTYTRGKRM